MTAEFDIDADKIKRLRIERIWTQEHLAEVADIFYRTVQRIEATGKASMESIRALANVFEIDSGELLRPAVKAAKGATPKVRAAGSSFLVRIKSGADLFGIVGGAHAGSVENEELESEAEVELVGTFLQEMTDWGEMWGELEPGERVRQGFEFTRMLKELDEAGFVVFGTREKKSMRVVDEVFSDWNVSIIRVLRSTNTAIVHLTPTYGASDDSVSKTQRCAAQPG